ncbi:putative ABC transporter ATP-binding protein YbhF [Variovorax sp. PBS-H4]|uniref:ATP-binding cassette domain-containing protein n=1 Tax=Variovorax sp. PBS-H4 TaxID=434008 RepID=UPI001316CC75|nr:ATP-binding cassette domain-containing protein [Variovorax sp. PBS-H4]VTU28284.1 putative ABC transporter ATP-binding protein YbhF [Variovorax sp. PBS-H4]
MLRVRGLTQRYGARVALDALSLSIPRGNFAVLLGPNGAGKSTLFQVLTGLFAAHEGEVEVAGLSMRTDARRALANIGVVFQQQSLDLDLSIAHNLRFHAALQGLPARETQERIAGEAVRFGIGADLQRSVRELSGGTRRKVELMRALLTRPQLLLMDEATVGLDPKSRRDLIDGLRGEVSERGVTVLWATHLVAEAEHADQVLVLHRGRLLADGPPLQVTAALGGATLEDAFLSATRQGMGNHPGDITA